MSDSHVTTGRCLCRDIQFEYRGAPAKTQHCHCESCRRHTSSPISTLVIVERSAFRYIRGTVVGYVSSPGVLRTHCGRCGSPISFESGDELAIYACTLDDPMEISPTFHSFASEQMPWLVIDDKLPRYEHGSRNKSPDYYGPRRPAN
jgi:hypothetical protein